MNKLQTLWFALKVAYRAFRDPHNAFPVSVEEQLSSYKIPPHAFVREPIKEVTVTDWAVATYKHFGDINPAIEDLRDRIGDVETLIKALQYVETAPPVRFPIEEGVYDEFVPPVFQYKVM